MAARIRLDLLDQLPADALAGAVGMDEQVAQPGELGAPWLSGDQPPMPDQPVGPLGDEERAVILQQLAPVVPAEARPGIELRPAVGGRAQRQDRCLLQRADGVEIGPPQRPDRRAPPVLTQDGGAQPAKRDTGWPRTPTSTANRPPPSGALAKSASVMPIAAEVT